MRDPERKGNWQSALATGIATFGGVGNLPRAPGTWGSLAALPFAYLVWAQGMTLGIFVTLLIVIVGSWAAHKYDELGGRHDSQTIVIDEVAGIFITTAVADFRWAPWIAAFVLFRFFDIAKPFPVRWIDRRVGGGFGVVADDVAAGVYAAIALFACQRLGLL